MFLRKMKSFLCAVLCFAAISVNADDFSANIVLTKGFSYQNGSCFKSLYEFIPYDSEQVEIDLPLNMSDFLTFSLREVLCIKDRYWEIQILGTVLNIQMRMISSLIIVYGMNIGEIFVEGPKGVLKFPIQNILWEIHECENQMQDYFITFLNINSYNFTPVEINGIETFTSPKRIDVYVRVGKGPISADDLTKPSVDYEMFMYDCSHQSRVLFCIVASFVGSGILFVIFMAIYDKFFSENRDD